MIEVDRVTKTYGKKTAVRDISFTAPPGMVTGLIGPNGAGKSTTLRVILGLTRPTLGTAMINGRAYRDLRFPLRTIGALLDDAGPVPERRAVDHLRWVARSNGIGRARVREVVELVGLGDKERVRVGKYSLGMKQRLGIATALLGDPGVVVLDEPMNGLDPEGIWWIRNLMQRCADGGATVLVASHFMTELESVAQRIVLISGGQVRAAGTVAEFTEGYESLEDAYFERTGGLRR